MRKWAFFMVLFGFFVLFLGKCRAIILQNQEQPKPSYTAGIKTARWRNPNSIQTDHNYSRVYVHNNPDGQDEIAEYVVTQTERTERVYPVYNAHSYGHGQEPESQGRLVRINSQSGQRPAGHGHFASLVGRNITGFPRTNRTIYKRKLEYKTVEVYKSCPDNATGQFVYYLNCNQFLNCWKGRGGPQNCSPGTLFNPKTLECDFPDKVKCLTGPRQNTLDGNQIKNTTRQVLCPRDFTGLIPNYTDCSKFINCNDGQYVSLDCPPGTLFDINQNICDFPYKSTCFNTQIAANQNVSYLGSGQYQLRFHQSGQYYGQNVSGLNQYQYGTQGGTQGGQHSQYESQSCNPFTRICRPTQSGQINQSDHGQGHQSQVRHGSRGNQFGWNSQNNQQVSGSSYQNGQSYQGPGGGGYRQWTQSFGAGQGQQGQPYHGNSGQYYQTYQGSVVSGGGLGHGSGHQASINSKLDFGQIENRTYDQGSSNRQRGNIFGNGQYTQNCNPHTQICYQNYGGYQQITTQQQYRPGGGIAQVSTSNCNPRTQNCGPTSTGFHYIVHGPRYNQTGQQNYNKICNINDPTCHRANNRNTTGIERQREPRCPADFQGITQHPSNCKKFLNCANGQTFIQDCAPGTLFNPSLKICDFPHNVDCANAEEEEATTSTYEESGASTDNWNQQYYNHAQRYGQNAGHGNVRQTTTTRPETQAASNQHGRYDQQTYYNQGNNLQGQGHPGQGQTTFTQGQFNRTWTPIEDIETDQYTTTTYRSLTPKPGHVGVGSNQNTGYNQTTIRDINRSQIGVVHRPTHVQTDQHTNQNIDQSVNNFPDYVDVFDPNEQKSIRSTSPRSADKSWPPPFPSTDVNADYVFEYDDGEPVTLEPESVFYSDKKKKIICSKGDFRCTANLCISKTMVCDGQRDCQNGKDEIGCQEYLGRFTIRKNHHLDVLEKQRWMNVSYTTCALLCIENTKFQCRSFNYRKIDKTCLLSDSNIGLSGALIQYYPCDYYELKSSTINCTNLYKCRNDKCIATGQLCDGVDDCGDREDEKNCRPADFGYSIRLAGSKERNEGRIEITAFGKTGYICDDQFGITDANVVCRELGFQMGAVEFKGNSYYARDLNETKPLYMMDDLSCFGNETTLLDCGFSGWGVHNCRDQEIAGVLCKTPQEKCGKGYWKCDTGNECVPFSFVCDGIYDCTDDSDEGAQHCEAPTELRLVNGTNNKEGRVEIKHHGIWGTVCDDDFNEDAAKVVCRYFGFKGKATVKKEAYFGSGEGIIWLDQVYCYGNETELHTCTHWNWGEHNCDHEEDVGVICSDEVDVAEIQRSSKASQRQNSSTAPIISCGFRKDNQFLQNDLIHARVVSGSLARKGDYPWQAALRVKSKEKSAHWCGAVVISSKWILTAAHCLQGYTKGAYIVVAGEYNTDEEEGTEQQKYIEEYFIHENFRKGHKMNNDIALIKLKGTGFVLNEDVQPICLPDIDANYERELNCTISGFGSVKSGTSASSHNLMAAWIPVHNAETCKMPHVYGSALFEGMICAGFLDGGVDSCDGDSGGPLACLDQGLFTLYGLTSWGQHCGYANKPGVYVKVAYYRQWIDNIIRKYS